MHTVYGILEDLLKAFRNLHNLEHLTTFLDTFYNEAVRLFYSCQLPKHMTVL